MEVCKSVHKQPSKATTRRQVLEVNVSIARTDIATVCSQAGLTGIAKFLTLPTLSHEGLWEHTQVVILWSTGVH